MGSPEKPNLRIIGGNPNIDPHNPPLPYSERHAQGIMMHYVRLPERGKTDADKEDITHMQEHRMARSFNYFRTLWEMAYPDLLDPESDPAA